jgi:hypothetical protein
LAKLEKRYTCTAVAEQQQPEQNNIMTSNVDNNNSEHTSQKTNDGNKNYRQSHKCEVPHHACHPVDQHETGRHTLHDSVPWYRWKLQPPTVATAGLAVAAVGGVLVVVGIGALFLDSCE